VRVRVDQSADAVYVALSDADIVEGEEVADGIIATRRAASSASKFSTPQSAPEIRRH
jgi:hypothetical protein